MSSAIQSTDFCYPPGTISVDEARRIILDRARLVAEQEDVALDDLAGRVLGVPLVSPVDVPGHDNSQMDGYAVRSADVPEAGVLLPVSQRIPAGFAPAALHPGTAARIFTGAPMPAGADCVVMQENARVEGESVFVPGPAVPRDNVRPRGNDIEAGQVVLEAGVRMFPQHIGLIASLGLASVPVRRALRVAFFSTGDELRMPGSDLAPGQIYNSNRFTVRALLRRAGCVPVDLGHVEDSLEATRAALRDGASRADVIVSSGGVSVGEEDHVKAALELEGDVELWRVAVRPGKPLAFGRVGEADFLGLPGNPVSVFVTFCLFVRPFLFRRLGVGDLSLPFTPVRAGFERPRAVARRDFARARLEYPEQEAPRATLHPRQGSDVLSSVAWGDGLVEVPEGAAVADGDWLRFLPFDALMS